MKHVLVVYATAHGSTRDIAERIATRLAESGLRTESRNVDEIDEICGYDAFVIGSAIHRQAWLPGAIRFVRDHATVLSAKPSWLFSVGIPAAVTPRLRNWARREGPKVTESQRNRIHPREQRLFSGVLRREHIPAFGRLMFRIMGGRFGDFRDTAEIDRWADAIARQLCDEQTVTWHRYVRLREPTEKNDA